MHIVMKTKQDQINLIDGKTGRKNPLGTVEEQLKDLREQVESLTNIVTVMNKTRCPCKSSTDDKD